MKMFYVLFLSFLFLPGQIFSQWVNEQSSRSDKFMSSYLQDSTTIIAAGDHETIIKTTDGGKDWSLTPVLEQNSCVHSVYFLDKKHGWAVIYGYLPYRHGGILYTSDGGDTWVKQYSINDYLLHSIYFADTSTGWAVGSNGLVLSTTDGGKNWSNHVISPYWLFSVYFLNRNAGYAAGGTVNEIYKTTNGGTDWSAVRIPNPEYFFSIYFINSQFGWAVGENGVIMKTTDGGDNWSYQISNTSAELRKVYFADTSNGYAVGLAGTLLRTTDGGTNWAKIDVGVTTDLYSISAKDGMVWVVGDSGLVLKYNNNQWVNEQSSRSVRFMSSYLQDSTTIIAAGDHETIIKTTNGGKDWSLTPVLEQNSCVHSVFFLDKRHGWAVIYGYLPYRHGGILYTSDGGDTWVKQYSINDYLLHSIYFADTSTGWAVGSNGLVLSTTDGGQNWSNQAISSYWLFSVYFLNKNVGYAAGGTVNEIYKTTNGGTDWNAIHIPNPEWFFSIYFTNSQFGWAVGENGVIMKTRDGGDNWSYQISNTNAELRKVYFADTSNGYAVGLAGTLLRTTDGGTNWAKIDVGVTTDLYSVSAKDGMVWVVGDSGLVLKNNDLTFLFITKVKNTSQLVKTFNLEQNYPNPFNPTTMISYSLPTASQVTLKVYDILGRELSNLYEGKQEMGTYNVSFNASKLSSGIYFYRLKASDLSGKAGNYTSIKKMILIK